MVSALDSGSNGPGSSPGRCHCIVFLGKTPYSYSASPRPRCIIFFLILKQWLQITSKYAWARQG